MDLSLPNMPPLAFVSEMNNLLPEKQGYTPGLHVFLVSQDSASGDAAVWSWEPKTPDTDAAIAQALEDIRHLHGS